jgi:hypothetical protein
MSKKESNKRRQTNNHRVVAFKAILGLLWLFYFGCQALTYDLLLKA